MDEAGEQCQTMKSVTNALRKTSDEDTANQDNVDSESNDFEPIEFPNEGKLGNYRYH